ncbi:hypothetical protein MPER_12146 [Moniliophthora perniciosa FA553]|nr:hypothetical protein MPER_12146 [Moniliophthora perniciosa FA553]
MKHFLFASFSAFVTAVAAQGSISLPQPFVVFTVKTLERRNSPLCRDVRILRMTYVRANAYFTGSCSVRNAANASAPPLEVFPPTTETSVTWFVDVAGTFTLDSPNQLKMLMAAQVQPDRFLYKPLTIAACKAWTDR